MKLDISLGKTYVMKNKTRLLTLELRTCSVLSMKQFGCRIGLFFSFLLAFCASVKSADTWETTFARMPLATNAFSLNLLHGVPALLNSFRSNETVKALVILPGATDDLHFFDRGIVTWTNAAPTLADAITALTNRTQVRASFHPPFLLLHTTNDLLDVDISLKQPLHSDKPDQKKAASRAIMVDATWQKLEPMLKSVLDVDIKPKPNTTAWWHFYRANFAGFGLTARETIQIVCLSAKVSAVVDRNEIRFSNR